MEVLIDANIILDVLQNRKPFVKASSSIWKLCETGETHGSVSTLSFADIVFVLRRHLDPDGIYELLSKLSLIFDFRDFSTTDMARAAVLGWTDYEDAAQSMTARRIRADYIITRNKKDFDQSPVPAVTPEEYLRSFSRKN